MPAATVNLERLRALLGQAAEAAFACLPLERSLLAGHAEEGTLPEEFLPGGGALGVTSALRGGLHGGIVLLVASGIGDAVLAGPLGASGLAAGRQPALARALGVLEQAVSTPVTLEPPAVIDPVVAVIAGAENASAFLGVPLFDGEAHRASLLLLLNEAASFGTSHTPHAARSDKPDRNTWRVVAPVHASAVAGDGPAVRQGVAHGRHRLHDVEVDVLVELGRARMAIRH